MKKADLDTVSAIEKALFAMPWSRDCFEHELTEEESSLCLVAEHVGSVVGYLVSWLVSDELHVGNIAVPVSLQGQGIGTKLLKAALNRARNRGAEIATLEVRMSNSRAIRMYERFGFRLVAMRKCYYTDNGEDAYVMFTELPRSKDARK